MFSKRETYGKKGNRTTRFGPAMRIVGPEESIVSGKLHSPNEIAGSKLQKYIDELLPGYGEVYKQEMILSEQLRFMNMRVLATVMVILHRLEENYKGTMDMADYELTDVLREIEKRYDTTEQTAYEIYSMNVFNNNTFNYDAIKKDITHLTTIMMESEKSSEKKPSELLELDFNIINLRMFATCFRYARYVQVFRTERMLREEERRLQEEENVEQISSEEIEDTD